MDRWNNTASSPRRQISRRPAEAVARWLASRSTFNGLAVGLSIACAATAPASAAAVFQLIYQFRGAPDGDNPQAGLVTDAGGRLYGTTPYGGSVGVGTVFQLTPPAVGQSQWTEQILHSITFADGTNPAAPVTLGSNGIIYGSTAQNGQFQRGAVFSILNQPNSPSTLLHVFDPADGGRLNQALVFGPGGLLYGTTPGIGRANYADTGTDFSLSPLGDTVEYRVIHAFGRPGDGVQPLGLAKVPRGYFTGFVGVTEGTAASAQQGGVVRDSGTFYTLQISAGGKGTTTIVSNFGPPPDLYDPISPPIVGQSTLKGRFYGCTAAGGPNNVGGVYEIAPNATGGATRTNLYYFGSHPNDAHADQSAQCYIVQGTYNGRLFGTTDGGGQYKVGAFFQLDPPTAPGGQWTERVIYSFNPATGSVPYGAPVRIGDAFYGALYSSANGFGGVYQITPN